MAEFVLQEPKTPTPVHIQTATGTGTTVHLTDHDEKTLCGRPGPLTPARHPMRWWQTAAPTCRQCIQAEGSKARVRREFR